MRCGFCPHDRDRTTESMEGAKMGYWAVWRGVLLQHTKGLCGYPVNRWSIKRPPNGTKLDRWSTGAIPRPLGKTRFIPKMFNTRSRKETRGGAPVHVGVSDCKTDNGENARMLETNTYANEMHKMT